MGCTSSLLQTGIKKKRMIISEIVVFVPTLQIPIQSELHKGLKGLIPKDIIDQLIALRNRVILLSEDTDNVAAIPDIKQALEEYLPVLIGLTKKGF
ncbi:polyprotein [Bienertia sinuspersici]